LVIIFCAIISIRITIFFIAFNFFWSLCYEFQRRGGGKWCCQYFTSSFCNENGMLELCRSLTIGCGTGPFIIPCDVFPHSLIDHRLNSEHVTLLHKSNCLILCIMWNLRCLMEHPTNTMTGVCSNDGVAKRLNVS